MQEYSVLLYIMTIYVGFLMELDAIINMLRINRSDACEDQKTRHVLPSWLDLEWKRRFNPSYEYVPNEYDLLQEYVCWLLNKNGCETEMHYTDKGSYIFGIKFEDIGTVYDNNFTSVSSLVTMITEGRAKFLEEMSRLGADLSRIQLQPMEWANIEGHEKYGPIFVENPEPMVFTWNF
jgi:hypothetical protein